MEKLEKTIAGPYHEVVSRICRSVLDKKITVPGNFTTLVFFSLFYLYFYESTKKMMILLVWVVRNATRARIRLAADSCILSSADSCSSTSRRFTFCSPTSAASDLTDQVKALVRLTLRSSTKMAPNISSTALTSELTVRSTSSCFDFNYL